jgi:hypothetical protein
VREAGSIKHALYNSEIISISAKRYKVFASDEMTDCDKTSEFYQLVIKQIASELTKCSLNLKNSRKTTFK